MDFELKRHKCIHITLQFNKEISMNARLGMLVLLCFALTISTGRGATLHVDMTPVLVGQDGFRMTPIDGGRTRFSIRLDRAVDPKGNEGSPFIRRARLEIYGDSGLLVRCPVEGRVEKSGHILYTFELLDVYAKTSSLTIAEYEDNLQIGGGSIYSYRLLDFIDPGHENEELFQRIRTSMDSSNQILPGESTSTHPDEQ